MKCHTCSETGVKSRESTIRMEVRGVPLEFKAEVEICDKCGHYSIPGRVAKEFGHRLDVAYRRAAGLLTIRQMVEARKRLGFHNQKDFADYLGVGEASVKRWEAGALLDKSSNELIRLKTDLGYAQRNVEKICALEGKAVPRQMVRFIECSPGPATRPSGHWQSNTTGQSHPSNCKQSA